MKYFPLLPLLGLLGLLGALPAAAADCPDLSGRYAWIGGKDDTGVEVTVRQTACNQATAVYDHADGLTFTRPMVFDGSAHPTFRQGEVVTWESFAWRGATLQIQTEVRWPAGSDARPLRSRGKLYLDGAGNLVEETDTLDYAGTAVWAHDTEKYRRR